MQNVFYADSYIDIEVFKYGVSIGESTLCSKNM